VLKSGHLTITKIKNLDKKFNSIRSKIQKIAENSLIPKMLFFSISDEK